MNPTNKVPVGTRVQTRKTAVLAWEELNAEVRTDKVAFIDGWNAALDSIILPEGKRFEVGDKCQAFHAGKGMWIDATIIAMETTNVSDDWDAPEDVRPLPQTVELTDDEKLNAVVMALVEKEKTSQHLAWAKTAMAFAIYHKTIDQLCAEYGVPTTREI